MQSIQSSEGQDKDIEFFDENAVGDACLFDYYLNHMNSAFIVLDNELRIKYVNNEICLYSGYTKNELLNKDFIDTLILEKDRRTFKNYIYEVKLSDKSINKRLYIPMINRLGESTHLEWTASTTTKKDINEKILLNACVVEDNNLADNIDLKELLENINQIFWIRDLNSNKVLYISPSYEKIIGRKDIDVIQNTSDFFNFIHPDDIEKVKNALIRSRISESGFDEEYRIIRADGVERWIWARTFNIRNKKSGLLYREAGVAEDITERKILQEKLLYHATTDSLTGARNRMYFIERLELEFSRAKRYKRKLSLIMLDIDNFKRINDTYGHIVGDKVLVQLVRICQQRIRSSDFVGRYGGEEFAIILLEMDNVMAVEVAENLRKSVEDLSLDIHGEKISFTVSFGVSDINKKSSVDDLLKSSDRALYRAKRTGKNKTCTE